MNIFNALNSGDSSIKEPHITSLLFDLFLTFQKDIYECKPIDEIIYKGLNVDLIGNLNTEIDLRLEEILKSNSTSKRRDLDISIYYRLNENIKTILNIENKIQNFSYSKYQLNDQLQILNELNPNAKIITLLILPFPQLYFDESEMFLSLYWTGVDDSVCKRIIKWAEAFINLNKSILIAEQIDYITAVKNFILGFEDFLNIEFYNVTNLNNRGAKNVLPNSMFNYLQEIAIDWDTIFGKTDVTVDELLAEFEKKMTSIFYEEYQMEAPSRIEKFKRGAHEAQPKIYTVNEKNRVHFNIVNQYEKQLFYYPEFLDGNYKGSKPWRRLLIRPLNKLKNNDPLPLVYYREKNSDITKFIELKLEPK
jgi:hypothetical protein